MKNLFNTLIISFKTDLSKIYDVNQLLFLVQNNEEDKFFNERRVKNE